MELGRREPDGATLRTHLQRLAASTGRIDERLRVQIPRAAAALWDAFLQLANGRRSGMSIHALTWTDIEAWCRLYRVQLTPWELDTLVELDAVAMAAAAAQRPPPAPPKP